MNPFYIVGAFSGDGIVYLEKPQFKYDRHKQPYVKLVPCLGWVTETHAVQFLEAMAAYFNLPFKKYKRRPGSFELIIRAKADVEKMLAKLSNLDHKKAHVHRIKVAELNLLQWVCDLNQQTGGYIRSYESLEKIMAESFRVAVLNGYYKKRSYNYETITEAIAFHLKVPLRQRKPYSFYVQESFPTDSLNKPDVFFPIELPKPKPTKPKKLDPSGRGKAVVAYGYFFPTLLTAEKELKHMKADLEKKLNRSIPISRKSLKRKLEDSSDLDVVTPQEKKPY